MCIQCLSFRTEFILYNALICTHIVHSCSKMCTAVEESTQHSECKAVPFSNTVFNDRPVTTSVTVFERLPTFIPKLVFEDASNRLVSVIN